MDPLTIDTRNGNPFANYVGRVDPAHFVGRQEESDIIFNTVDQGGNVSITGLPRMGKTSILYHSLLDRQKELLHEKNMLVAGISMTANNSTAFWKTIADRLDFLVGNEADEIDENDQRQRLFRRAEKYYNNILVTTDSSTCRSMFKNYLSQLKDNLHYRVVICIDEFQSATFLEKYDFMAMHEFSDAGLAIFVTASRKSFKTIELCCHKEAYFYKNFREIYIKSFSPDDAKLYWEHCKPRLNLDGAEWEEYMQNAVYYAGRHPALLNLFNHAAYEVLRRHADDIEIAMLILCDEDAMRPLLNGSNNEAGLRYQVTLLKEEELLKPAIEWVAGPLAKATKDEAQQLVELGFLEEIPYEQKHKLFNGNEVGPWALNKKQEVVGYVCFSHFYTRLFYYGFPISRKYDEIWYAAENKMRAIIITYLMSEFGIDSLEIDEEKDIKEKWIERMWHRLTDKRNPYSTMTVKDKEGQLQPKITNWKLNVEKLLATKRRELKKHPNSRKTPLVMSSETGQAYFLFFDTDWGWFEKIFKQPKKHWKHNVFDPLDQLRNPHAHNSIADIPNIEYHICEEHCANLIKQIDNFIGQLQETNPDLFKAIAKVTVLPPKK